MRGKEVAALAVGLLLSPIMCRGVAPWNKTGETAPRPSLSAITREAATATAQAQRMDAEIKKRVDEELARRTPPSAPRTPPVSQTPLPTARPGERPPFAVPPWSLPPPEDVVMRGNNVFDAQDPNLEWEKAYHQDGVREGTVQRDGCFRVDRYYDQSPRSLGHVYRNTPTGGNRC